MLYSGEGELLNSIYCLFTSAFEAKSMYEETAEIKTGNNSD